MTPIVYTQTVGANGTSTTGLNLKETFKSLYGLIPSLSTNAAVNVLASSDGTNYYEVPSFAITSGNNNAWNALPTAFQYLKFQVTGTVCASADITVLASNQW